MEYSREPKRGRQQMAPIKCPTASLLLERIRQVRNSVPPHGLSQTTAPAVNDDCPRYLLVDKDTWSPATILSYTLEDILLPLWTMWSSFSGLFLGQCPGSLNNKSSRLRGPRRMLPTTPTGSSCYRQGCL
ncbi:hypothetical protein JTB14_009362 [Gonioctena quinquepunctata]|nr:hypothetical protein JTB14_009362 [Gonioctena quinquepunctata]